MAHPGEQMPTRPRTAPTKPAGRFVRILMSIMAGMVVVGGVLVLGFGMGLVFVWSWAQEGDQKAIESLPFLVPAYGGYILGYIVFVVVCSRFFGRYERN